MITKEQIEELYINQKLGIRDCAKQLNLSVNKFRRLLKQYDIEKAINEITAGIQNTFKKNYGCHPSKLDEIKQKKKQTRSEKDFITDKQLEDLYINQNKGQREVAKELDISVDALRRRLKEHEINKPDSMVIDCIQKNYITGIAQQKCNETKHKNNSFNTSKAQVELENLLKQKFDKVETEYNKDPRYPYECDFYIPSLDLFIEYQGTWQHGNKPYDKDDPECIRLVDLWKRKIIETQKESYKVAIERYTQRDPLKRQIAKNNNLNFKELWSMQEAIDFINSL